MAFNFGIDSGLFQKERTYGLRTDGQTVASNGTLSASDVANRTTGYTLPITAPRIKGGLKQGRSSYDDGIVSPDLSIATFENDPDVQKNVKNELLKNYRNQG